MPINTISAPRTDYTKRIKDVMGRLKISKHQNIYDADFEYGKQPMRWDEYVANGGTISHLGGAGGCALYLPDSTTNPNALTIRQSRPYHRYQPGKGMFMATAVNFGTPATNQFQRVGFFDDSNGVFFEQGPSNANNPSGMYCVVRSDTNYSPSGVASVGAVRDVKIDFANWLDPHGIKFQINWSLIQMLWVEYAWYGAGCLRWGVLINGEPYILHEIGSGNNSLYGGGMIGAVTQTAGININSNSLAFTNTAGLSQGMVISGLGIPSGTTLTQTPISTTGSWSSGSTTILVANATGIVLGQGVSGTGIATGSAVSGITGTTITLTNATFAQGVSGTAVNFYPLTAIMSANATLTGSYALNFSSQSFGITPWSRTGNLPVRYEQRGSGVGAAATTMYHYGVSVIIEGESDEQRGFTYSYGMNSSVPRRYVPPNSVRYPVLSIQSRSMGTQEFSHIGGPATSQQQIASATINSLRVVSSGQYNLPQIKSFNVNGGFTTIRFAQAHNLPVTGGSITLSGFSPSIINTSSPYSYTYQSANSITISNSNNATQIGSASVTSLRWDANQWTGRNVYFLGTDNKFYVGKITSNTSDTIVFCDPQYVTENRSLSVAPNVGTTGNANFVSGSFIVTTTANLPVGTRVSSAYLPVSTIITQVVNAAAGLYIVNNPANLTINNAPIYFNQYFCIGQINRGQLLPRQLVVSSDSLCVVELIASAADNPVVLQNSDFQPLTNLGSANSFATRDVEATSMSINSGEVVYAFTTPAGGAGLQQIDLANLFPLYNTITGNNPDILTLAVSTRATNSAGAQCASAVMKFTSFTGNITTGVNTITNVPTALPLYVGQALSSQLTGINIGTTITNIFRDTRPVVSTNATIVRGSSSISVSSATGIVIGQGVTGTGIATGTYVTGITGTTISLNQIAIGSGTGVSVTFTGTATLTLSDNAIATLTNTNLFGWYGVLTYIQPHGLSVNDQIVLSNFTPSGWNGTWSVASVLDIIDVVILPASTTLNATNIGDSTFTSGANVGAHLICQEAMS